MRGTLHLILMFLLCGVICSPRSVTADDDPQARLAALNLEVESAEKALSEITEIEALRVAELRQADERVKKSQREFAEKKKEVQVLSTKRAELRARADSAARERDAVVQVAKARLRALYMHRDDSFVEWVIAGESPSAVRRTAVYFNRVREFDLNLVSRLREVITRNEESQKQLAATLQSLEKALNGQKAQEQELKERSREQKAILESVRGQKLEREKTISALRAQALRLETVVRSYTGGDAEEMSRDRRKKRKKQVDAPQGVPPPFEGKGLHALKGALVWPVKGEVVQRFGKTQVKEFSDVVFNKGLDIKASEGSEVRSIAEGRVIFVGRLPGYGTVVILDHGKRYYSLYGRLSEVTTARGTDLEKGDSLGRAGSTDQKGSNLYFEIRHNGTPVNPQTYLGKTFR